MGWLFGWATRRELIHHLLAPQRCRTRNAREEYAEATVTTIRHCLRGKRLWCVDEVVFDDGSPAKRQIVGYELGGANYGHAQKGYDDVGWGYKYESESMGLDDYTCPIGYFDLVPDPGSYATAWREECRQRHERPIAARTSEHAVPSTREKAQIVLELST